MTARAFEELRLTGYFPGVVGKITELHAVYYSEHWGFDITFEAQVARELSLFLSNFQTDRDGFWVALLQGRFAGAIAIDGTLGTSEGARLRWFIVEPRFHGNGVGRELIRSAVEFCRNAGYHKVFLWTFRGLDAARKLYEQAGFTVTEESEVDQWGSRIVEQKFEMTLDAAS
ncbi:MAG: GNAT family N-acetyltransferase [Desulfomonile tiedjei]|uniref:GNAT family N-acetyltransferase n=1 Tax=Desulfomonile tiedjei TaxID=2358 RepID=A0A9D6V845_9BACT|nr:GNAT family N-acetyltransferase [Desulfomonile tiedjei]